MTTRLTLFTLDMAISEKMFTFDHSEYTHVLSQNKKFVYHGSIYPKAQGFSLIKLSQHDYKAYFVHYDLAISEKMFTFV